MPVRSLNSSVFKWPDRTQADAAFRTWADEAARLHPELVQLGYFGSYARDDWGVGSDLDIVAIVKRPSTPFERRSLDWDLSQLPVPAEVLVYTQAEWQQMQVEGGRFIKMLTRETVWAIQKIEKSER